jgi:outer membrane receptor protein involved in Fe transport
MARNDPVWAQRAGAGELEEITVTATRQAVSIQDVPVSVSALDQSAITQFGISNIEDIARLTPGLDSSIGNTGQSIITIRGIYSIVGTATTGVYIDDTPIQVRFLGAGLAAGSSYPTLFDLDRIEVLRGPQGTLFGSGSEGGTLRFITPDPSLTRWSGHARSEFSFNQNGSPSTQFGVAGGGPIVAEQLGFRVSVYAQSDGGWLDRAPYPSSGISERNTNSDSSLALSAALSWKISSNLTLTPSLFYQRQNVDNQSTF